MKLTFDHNQKTYRCDLGEPHSIAIEMNFEGPQPRHFGVDRASREAIEIGDFVGRTSRGGSCNVDKITIVPHCNGTHTESVGHIVDDNVYIAQQGMESMHTAIVVSLHSTVAKESGDSYRPSLNADDRIITREAIDRATSQWRKLNVAALIIRTLPTDSRKSQRDYGLEKRPPFLTIEAIERINEMGCEHLVVDIPSLDRAHDQGLLTCHHLFWGVPEATHRLTETSNTNKTVTEMVLIPDAVKDGFYLLNLQIPAFLSDAAPSRPILFAAKEIK